MEVGGEPEGLPQDGDDARRSERGQGMVEYAFIVILVAIVLIVMVQLLGHQTSTLFSNVSNGLNA